MSWLKNLNPFKKKEDEAAAGPEGLPQLPPELADDPKAKLAMGAMLRHWKNPAFLKQLRTLAGHMRRDGVDLKDMGAVKAWLEKNQERVARGDFAEEAPQPGETFVKTGPDTGRNDPCHCGSGKKFKKCHGRG